MLFYGPCVFGILAGFSILFVWSRCRHGRDAARNKSGTARCGRSFPLVRGALVPRRFEALKVNSTPVLGTGRCPCGPERLKPSAFDPPPRHCERSSRRPPQFREWELLCDKCRLSLLLGKVALLVPQIPATAIFRAAGRIETPGKRCVAPAFLLG